jgi:hypothetical protein
MSQRDDFQAIKDGLGHLSKDELIEVIHHLTHAYVIEGTQPFKAEQAMVNVPRFLRELDFPQLVIQLKRQLGLPELELFSVSEGQVWVSIGGRDFVVSPNAVVDVQPARAEDDDAPAAPAAAPMDAGPVRGLEIDDEPAPAAAAPPAPPPRPARPAPAPAAPPPAPKKKPPRPPADTGGTSDRFKMLDLD